MEAVNQTPLASSPPVSAGAGDIEEGVIFDPRRVTQAFVLFAIAICYWLFSIGGSWVGFPGEFKHSGSVLFQGDPIGKLIVFWVLLVVCTALATVMTSWRWFLAGLFACLGSRRVGGGRGDFALCALLRLLAERVSRAGGRTGSAARRRGGDVASSMVCAADTAGDSASRVCQARGGRIVGWRSRLRRRHPDPGDGDSGVAAGGHRSE